MHSIRRSCQSVLRSSDSTCTYAIGSRRAFSRTCSRSRGALPVFLEASTPELSSLLATLNSKILLPKHLTKEQQKLVYRQENKAKLQAEPVEITLGDVTLPLEPLQRNHLPSRWGIFSDVVKSSETREDWENVVRMLEGFENAGTPLNSQKKALVVRSLSAQGHHNLILKALQRAKSTGMRMREWNLVSQVFRAIYDKAALSDWEKEETAKALRLAKQVVELLEDEEHCGGQVRVESASGHDFRAKPAVVAVPTGIAAVSALRHEGDVEEVKKLAGRLVAALKKDDYSKFLDAAKQKFAVTEADFSKTIPQVRHTFTIIQDLQELVWISTALKTSLKVLGNDMPNAEDAREYESMVTKTLEEGCEALKRLRIRDGQAVVRSMADYVLEIAEETDVSK